MSWIIRDGTIRGEGRYWSHTHNYDGQALFRETSERAVKFFTWQSACVALGNLSDRHEARIVRLKTRAGLLPSEVKP